MWRRVPDQRAVAGAAVTATFVNVDQDGEPAAAAATPTVAVVRSSTGAAVSVAAGVAAGTGTGEYTIALTAAELGLELDQFHLTWSVSGTQVATTVLDLVGGVYFTTAEFAARYPRELDGTYTTAQQQAARRIAELEAEAITCRAFVPRYAEADVVVRHSAGELALPAWDIRSVVAVYTVAADGTETAFTSAQLATLQPTSSGLLRRVDGTTWPEQVRYRIGFTYGLEQPPADLQAAAMTRALVHAAQALSGIPTKAKTFSSADGGTYGLALAAATKTGDDDVDAVYARHARSAPGLT